MHSIRDGGRFRRALPPVAVFVVAAIMLAVALGVRDRMLGDSFDLVRWERDTIANKWLHALGAPLRRDPSAEEAIARYFALSDRSTAEAGRIQGAVEAAIEGRIDAVARAQGLAGRLPLPGGISIFPPVNFDLATPPEVLIVSPRAVIARERVRLLRPGLTLADAEALEREIERDHTRSALVVASGGVATYPAIVSNGSSYSGTVATAAHEWTHHYLAFYPLGFGYYSSADLTTINETVADIVGDELRRLVLDRYGDPTVPTVPAVPAGSATPAASAPAAPPGVRADVNETLRALRLEVDALLVTGRVDEAEARMEQVRVQLADGGVRIRRINQAYFAWYGTYAARADSVDLIGPQLRELRTAAGSLVAFLAAVRGVGSRADVERALARAGGGG